MSLAAVIGAQFGDEGKGLVTDYLSSLATVVVRFNGGAQAGHTVVTPEGRRHEFHHVGSGTFRGASTLLSRFFIVNPILFAKELGDLGGAPIVTVDPRCRVTTPFDMLLNRAIETARSTQRHGSCGLGINETVERCQTPYELTVSDLLDPVVLRHKLQAIADEYVPRRAEILGIAPPRTRAATIDRFIDCAADFAKQTQRGLDADAIQCSRDIVFEGAQGLRLDEVRGTFPHVTRSRTGLTNIEILLHDADRTDPLDVFYVTRVNPPRPGAGPLTGEVTGHPYGWTGDETNVSNEFQGKFRYAPMNVGEFNATIHADLRSVSLPVRPRLAVTCQDQQPSTGVRTHGPFTLDVALASFGRTRAHVRGVARAAVMENQR